jgi:uncharacterized lipoprotein
MNLRLLPSLLAVIFLSACGNLSKEKKADHDKKPKEPKMSDASGDVTYQAFLGRLRKAVEKHDVQEIASMMTPDFGYRLDPPGEGEGVFQYWDEKGLWPELQSVLNERFAPKGNFMVAPTQFALDPDYHGYRAGITMLNGSWKFAYFVAEQ